MIRVLEFGLLGAVCVAVLGFGGTVPYFFAISQVLVLGLGILFLFSGEFSRVTSFHFPVAVPSLLLGVVLLQVCPLPASLASFFGRTPQEFSGSSLFTISMARYQTESHLLLLVTYLTAFSLTLVLCRNRLARKRAVLAVVSLGVFEALYGLIQYLTGWQQIFTYVKKYYLEDATGTYISRNHFAGFLEMALPFAVALAFRKAELLRKGTSGEAATFHEVMSSREPAALVFWLCVAVLLSAALVLSRSRMGIISGLVSLVGILALAGTSGMRRRTRLVVVAIFLIGVFALLVWIGVDPVLNRFEILGEEYTFAGQNRISIWRDTLGLVRHHPLIGTGLGSFSEVYPSVQTAFQTLLVEHAHCDYLELAAELGLPACALLLVSIYWILIQCAWRYRKLEEGFDKVVALGCVGSLTAILVHSLADFNLYIPGNALVFTIILAMARSAASLGVAAESATR